ncbi:MAG TPA: hypothetical protein VFP12_03505 [Allosphingosinicella sp.]|nr:hypothetical protein [Allosphingosinicella sp.]
MISFVALVGQQTLSKVEQGTEIAWKESAGASQAAVSSMAGLEAVFSHRIGLLPTAYSMPASLSDGDDEATWEAFRVGTCVCGDRMIAYFGRFTFAQVGHNSRGRIPFGLAYGVVLNEEPISLNPNITKSISKLFNKYHNEAISDGKIIRSVRAYNNENIANKWDFSATDFVLDDGSQVSPLSIESFSENIATFIAHEGQRTFSDIVARLAILLDGRAVFDAFIAIDDQLDRSMKAQAKTGMINHLSVDDFVESVVAKSAELVPSPTPSAPKPTRPVPAPIDPPSPPAAAKVESTPASPKPAQGAKAQQKREPEMEPLVASLQQVASGLTELKERLPDPTFEGPWKGFESPMAKVALAALLACGPLALLAVGYDRYFPSDRAGEGDAQTGNTKTGEAKTGEAKTDDATSVNRCLEEEVQIAAMSSTNPVWRVVLGRAAETSDNAPISELTIGQPREFIQEGHAMFVDQLRKCLERE